MNAQACEAQRKLAGNMSPIAFNAGARVCPFSERAEEKADARIPTRRIIVSRGSNVEGLQRVAISVLSRCFLSACKWRIESWEPICRHIQFVRWIL